MLSAGVEAFSLPNVRVPAIREFFRKRAPNCVEGIPAMFRA
jgi:hypothetical protein